jgi:hypothetical protein
VELETVTEEGGEYPDAPLLDTGNVRARFDLKRKQVGEFGKVGFGSGTAFQATSPPCLLLRMEAPEPRESGRTRLSRLVSA